MRTVLVAQRGKLKVNEQNSLIRSLPKIPIYVIRKLSKNMIHRYFQIMCLGSRTLIVRVEKNPGFFENLFFF